MDPHLPDNVPMTSTNPFEKGSTNPFETASTPPPPPPLASEPRKKAKRNKWKQTISERSHHAFFGSASRQKNKDRPKHNHGKDGHDENAQWDSVPTYDQRAASTAISTHPPPVPSHNWLLKPAAPPHNYVSETNNKVKDDRLPRYRTSLRLQAASAAVAHEKDLNPQWQTHIVSKYPPSSPVPTSSAAPLFYFYSNHDDDTTTWPVAAPEAPITHQTTHYRIPEMDDPNPWR